MTKHAYLIIAHNKFKQLSFLINLLDDSRNDIYILIDKKSSFNADDQQLIKNSVKFSKIFLLHNVSINWGDYSQIKAELTLFEAAYQHNIYEYYHLLSGQDLPLHNQNYIHTFFDAHPNKIFLSVPSPQIYSQVNIPKRVIYNYHFIKLHGRSKLNRYGKKFFRILENLNFLVQKITGITSKKTESLPPIHYASNWVSLNNEAVGYLLAHEKDIQNIFQHAFLCDELFVPTILLNQPKFQKMLYSENHIHDRPDELQGNLRYINWWDGSPYVWTDNDLSKLEYARNLGHLFSRKFNLSDSPKVKSLIKTMCLSDN